MIGSTSILESRVVRQSRHVDELRSGSAQLAVIALEAVAHEMDSRLFKPERYVLVATPIWK